MTNETKELKTYTMQELYEHPLEPMACLVDGLLAPGWPAGSGIVHTGWFTQSRKELDGAAALPRCVRRRGLFGARNAEKRGALPGAGGWPTAAAQPGFAAGRHRAGGLAPLPPGGTHRPGPGTADRSVACGTSAYPAGGAGHTAKGAAHEWQRDVLQQRLRGCRHLESTG